MRYLLDTNTCIEHLRRGGSRALKRRMLSLDPVDVAISVITGFELRIGAHRRNAPDDEPRIIDSFLGALTSIPLDESSIELAVQLQVRLQAEGSSTGAFDAMIAGTALRNDLTLVTHNVREFSRVRQLRIEDWQS